MNDASDDELLTSVAKGEKAALEALRRRYARPVFGLALRLLGGRDAAEEATWRSFASVWRAAPDYGDADRPVGRWLYEAALHEIAAVAEAAGEALPADDAAWRAWCVHRSLERLETGERRVIELGYWSGLTQAEVADFLGIPSTAVAARTRAAVGRLAAFLESEPV